MSLYVCTDMHVLGVCYVHKLGAYSSISRFCHGSQRKMESQEGTWKLRTTYKLPYLYKVIVTDESVLFW